MQRVSSTQDFQEAVEAFQSQTEELARLLGQDILGTKTTAAAESASLLGSVPPHATDATTAPSPTIMRLAKSNSSGSNDSATAATLYSSDDSDEEESDSDDDYSYDSDDSDDDDWDSDLEDLEAELTGSSRTTTNAPKVVVSTSDGGKMLKTSNSSPALLAMGEETMKAASRKGAAELFNPTTAPAAGLQNLKERIQRSESTSFLQSPEYGTATQPDTLEQPYASLKPDDQLKSILEGFSAAQFPSNTWHDYFLEMNDDHIDAYTADVEKAVRAEDFDTLRAMIGQGQTLQCCNKHGESILHIACRRGSTELIQFLLEDAKVDPRIRDDVGRTPLHDACWSHKPNFDVIMMLLQEAPELLFIIDHRGFTPLCYAPRVTWSTWNDFLQDHRQFLRDMVKSLRFDRARYFIKTMVPCLKF